MFYLWLFFVPNYHPFTTTTDLDKWQQWQDKKKQYKKVETTAERMGQIEEADQEVSRSP